MDWKKIAPWNWFKDEQVSESAAQVPARLSRSADPFTAFRTEMDRLFDEAFRGTFLGTPALTPTPGRLPTALRPSVDVSEGKKAYTIRAELPGVEPVDVSIEVEGNRLVIRAEKRQEQEEEDEGYHCIERSYGAMQRVLTLPDDADTEGIEAKFKHGVLRLRIPKHPARASSARTIEVQSG